MGSLTQYRTDPDLTETFVRSSYDTLLWLQTKGIRYMPLYRQAFKIEGRMKFWGGLALESWGGGPGLVELEQKSAASRGIENSYAHRAATHHTEGGGEAGGVVKQQ